jgi:hypothetical protein
MRCELRFGLNARSRTAMLRMRRPNEPMDDREPKIKNFAEPHSRIESSVFYYLRQE